MKTPPTPFGLVLVALLLTACGSQETNESHSGSAHHTPLPDADALASTSPPAGDLDATVNAYMAELESMSALFAKVVDEDSARQYGPEVKKASSRLKGYVAQLETVDSAQRGMAFASKAQRFMKIQASMMPELGRISQDPVLSRHMGDSMKIPSLK